MVVDKIDDDLNLVEVAVGRDFRCKATAQGATMTWLRPVVKVIVSPCLGWPRTEATISQPQRATWTQIFSRIQTIYLTQS